MGVDDRIFERTDSAPRAAAAVKKARTQTLPGVVTDNWTLNKGSLGLVPKGDDPMLPGVKTAGW